jgi:glycosyltransferase involved in cell wall biosynthesis
LIEIQKKTSEAPTVSVIIPTFQRPDETRVAIASVLAQTAVDDAKTTIEVLVIDDASNPPFRLEGAYAEDPRIRLITCACNGGAGAARNEGVRHARGVWLAFLDSDDTWRKDRLSRQLAFAAARESRGRLSVIASGFSLIDGNRHRVRDMIPVEAETPSMFASACWFCPGSAILMRRKTFVAVGFYDESFRRLEDLDWYLRFGLLGGELLVIPEVLVDIHVGKRPSPAKIATVASRMRSKYFSGTIFLPPPTRRALDAYLTLEEAAAYWHSGKPFATLALLLRSWLLVPRLRVHLQNFWRRRPNTLSMRGH